MLYGHLPRRTARALTAALLAALGAVTLMMLAYAYYAAPNADDFCRAALSGDMSQIWAHVQHNYADWSGRWVVHAFYFAVFPHLPISTHVYGALVATSALIWFAVCYLATRILFRDLMSWREKALLAFVLAAVLWSGEPGLGETWTWLTGLCEYEAPFLFLMLCLSALTSSWVAKPGIASKLFAAVTASLFAILVTGINELVGVLLVGLIVVGGVLALLRKRLDVAAVLAVTLLVTLVGLAINVSAPGTAVRAGEDFPHAHDLFYALRLTLLEPGYAPLQWLTDPRLMLMALVLLSAPAFLKLRPAWAEWRLPLRGALALMVVAALVITLVGANAALLLVNYAQGIPTPGRILNIVFAFFIVGCFVTLAAAAPLFRSQAESPVLRMLSIAAGIALPLALITSPNFLTAAADLKLAAGQWRPAVDSRDVAIRAQPGRDVAVAAIPQHPRLYFWNDLSPDPAGWRNVCMSNYYRVHSLRAAQQQP
ncbi:MAG: DUF6056 family protein [Vitreimonas sp.]